MVLLPVPFMPAMNHVSSMVSSAIGMSERPKFAISPRSFFMWMPHAAHCACSEPDAHGQRPVTRQPPSTGTAAPFGASDPATHASRIRAPHVRLRLLRERAPPATRRR